MLNIFSTNYKKEFTLRDRGIFFLLLSLVIVLISAIWIKTRTISSISGDYLLIGYAILLTVFQLLRITSALFYKDSFTQISGKGIIDKINNKYEPSVTFVIPCKNEEEAISTTINKCFEVDYPKEKIEVIVINDGSTDDTARVLDNIKENQHPELKVIHFAKNKGKRHGMYAGFTNATGEIIIQLDSDSYILPSTFKKLIEPFKNETIGAVCAHANPQNADENWITKMQAAYYFIAFRILKAAESTFGIVFCCSGCSSAYRKSIVLPLLKPWLEETFLGQPVTWGDDRSLTSHVIKNGYKTVYTDLARAVTIVPSTFKKLLKQQVRWKKSWIINALFTGKFIWRVDPFIAFIYYYPLIVLSILTPIMTARAIFYIPLFVNLSSIVFYILGILIITSVFAIFSKFVLRGFKYWPYLFLWSIFNVFILSFTIFYAVITIQNRSWGTR